MADSSGNKTFYEILEIQQTATLADIKKAYRKLAMKYHPDRNRHTDTKSKFIEVQRAYDTLSDTNKKQVYDQQFQQFVTPYRGFGSGGMIFTHTDFRDGVRGKSVTIIMKPDGTAEIVQN